MVSLRQRGFLFVFLFVVLFSPRSRKKVVSKIVPKPKYQKLFLNLLKAQDLSSQNKMLSSFIRSLSFPVQLQNCQLLQNHLMHLKARQIRFSLFQEKIFCLTEDTFYFYFCEVIVNFSLHSAYIFE